MTQVVENYKDIELHVEVKEPAVYKGTLILRDVDTSGQQKTPDAVPDEKNQLPS